MKKLVFITQSKGGAGKSILTFLLAEKYREAVILDMDDATKTSTLQLNYRKPIPITFLNDNNVIDRGYFNNFLERISNIKNDLFVADLGASISEQLPFYLDDVKDFLVEVLEELKIELEIFNVVGGGNIFNQTMSYLRSLVTASDNRFKVRIFKNEYYAFSEEQTKLLNDYANEHELEIVPFNISKDHNQSTQDRIREVLKSGKGIEDAGIISKKYFTTAFQNLTV